MNKRVFRFLICGCLAALINVMAFSLLYKAMQPDNILALSILNMVAIEISLLFSFFAYRYWVWPLNTWSLPDVFLRQLPLYHVSCSLAILLRVILVFPTLDFIGVDYRVNTITGILIGFWVNYMSGETLIFRNKTENKVDLIVRENFENISFPKLTEEATKHVDSHVIPVNLLSIVIPAYNEEDCIRDTVYKIHKTLSYASIPFEILIINDNSKDSTLHILKSLSQELNHVNYMTNYYPNGFGFAVRCGLENFTGDAVAVVMADSSDAPEDIIKYYHILNQGYDCVFGSRFSEGGQVFDYPSHKLLINRLANLFIQIVMSVPHNDITNAFKAYRKEVIQGVSPLISHHFNLTVEIPLKAIMRGYSYATVPITWHNRQTGISKLKIREMGSRYLFIVLSIFLEKFLSRGDYIHHHKKLPNSRK